MEVLSPLFGCGSKVCTQNGILVNGHLRSPGGLVLTHTHFWSFPMLEGSDLRFGAAASWLLAACHPTPTGWLRGSAHLKRSMATKDHHIDQSGLNSMVFALLLAVLGRCDIVCCRNNKTNMSMHVPGF